MPRPTPLSSRDSEAAAAFAVGELTSAKPRLWPRMPTATATAEDPAAKRRELIDAYREIIDVYIAARNDMIDDVIDPRETRPVICRALEMAENKRVERPWKRHGVVPV